ncbi:MAG: HAMP domain-containing histidine kinase [Butyrivibrio sp.]|nr:HAMP domain-containing histidine kinase [Butyrivibrio sp.]
MTRNQKILLIISCILYVFVIYGFFSFDLYLIVVLFVLHSIAIIMFAYLAYNDKGNPEEIDRLQQEIGIMRAENAETVRDCDNKISEMKKEVERAENQLQDEKTRNEGLLKEIEEKKNESDEMIASINEKASISSFLPEIDDEDEKSEVDIIEVAKRVADELSEAARKAKMQINISTSEGALKVKASEKRIVILFRNIIDNSIKYMNQEGILVITISAINDDIFIVLKDSGKGLAESETKHIFELNYQGSNRISGNGLGLTQAKAIVDYYGGNIYARSSEGKGMGIYIQLPTSAAAN